MSRLFYFLAGGLGTFVVLLAFAATDPKPTAQVHFYRVTFTNDGSSAVLKGESIRSAGMCSEVILNGRVDTVFCTGHVITEIEPPPQMRPAVPTVAEVR